MENYNSNSNINSNEFDITIILYKFIKHRYALYKAIILGCIIGFIIAYSIPKTYTVNVTLSPEITSNNNSELASLASSLLGTNNKEGGRDALQANMATDIIASTPYLLEIYNTPIQTINGDIDTTLQSYLDYEKSPWWKKIIDIPFNIITKLKSKFINKPNVPKHTIDPFQLTREEYGKINKLRSIIKAEINKKTGFIIISVTLQDPKASALLAENAVKLFQQYITKYRITKAKEDCEYLEKIYHEREEEYYKAQLQFANYVDSNRNIILQTTKGELERLQNKMNLCFQVYSQVAQQLQIAQAKVQENKPVFAIIEPATIPLNASAPNKPLIIIGVSLLFIFLTIGWIFIGTKIVSFYKKGCPK